jgi:hypothetical protein
MNASTKIGFLISDVLHMVTGDETLNVVLPLRSLGRQCN